ANADKETKVEDQFFVLTAVVRDPSILPQLQGALVDYLLDNTFIRQREEQRRKGFEEMLTRIDADIARLDSMKTLIGKGRLKLPVGTTLIDPADPYTSSIGLYQKHADLIYELGRVKSIQMVEGFGPAVESARPSVKRFVLAGIIIGVLLAALIVFVRFTRDLVRRSDSTQAPS
ncbi:MAG: hypothetical protein HC859_14865, partial [Bacteroidia bacterium]|nr:hypothetical protein [Bacteroidia bacterium]